MSELESYQTLLDAFGATSINLRRLGVLYTSSQMIVDKHVSGNSVHLIHRGSYHLH